LSASRLGQKAAQAAIVVRAQLGPDVAAADVWIPQGDEQQIKALRPLGSAEPEEFAGRPLEAIPDDGGAYFFGGRDPQPAARQAVEAANHQKAVKTDLFLAAGV
jgi:hypothetical protein